MAGRVVLLVVLALMLLFGISVVNSAHVSGSPDTTITNETWTPDAGNVTTLNHSNLDRAYYDENVTVRDENKTVMEPGTDYEWYDSNGTVKALVGGGLEGDANATITYGYQQASETSTTMTAAFAGLFDSIGRGALLVVGAAAVLASMRVLAGGGI